MKVCDNCGKSVKEDAAVCPFCGNFFAKTKDGPEDRSEGFFAKGKLEKMFPVILVGCGLLATVVIAFLLVVVSRDKSGYQRAISDYQDIKNGKAGSEVFERMYPEKTLEEFETSSGITPETLRVAAEQKNAAPEFGLDYSDMQVVLSLIGEHEVVDEYALEVLKKEIAVSFFVSEDSVGSVFRLMLREDYVFDVEKVGEAQRYDALTLIEDGRFFAMYAAEIDGEWYLMHADVAYSHQDDILAAKIVPLGMR